MFYEMSPLLSIPLILQFGIRKRKLFGKGYNVNKSVKLMYEGSKEYRKTRV